jgi:hypothetical protein
VVQRGGLGFLARRPDSVGLRVSRTLLQFPTQAIYAVRLPAHCCGGWEGAGQGGRPDVDVPGALPAGGVPVVVVPVVVLFGDVLVVLFPMPADGFVGSAVPVVPAVVEELLGCVLLLVLGLVLGLVVVLEVDGTVLTPGVFVGSHGTPLIIVDGVVLCDVGIPVCAGGVAVRGVGEAVCAGGVAVCGVGVAVCAGGVAVCGVGVAVCAGGVAVCGVGVAVCAGGVAVCRLAPALADTAARQTTSAKQENRRIFDIIGSLQICS